MARLITKEEPELHSLHDLRLRVALAWARAGVDLARVAAYAEVSVSKLKALLR